jgi:tetratricopeptide (TPR) repeat protein
MLCDALRLHVGNATKNINKYFDAIDLDEDLDSAHWMSMVLFLISEGAYKEADEAIRIFNRINPMGLPDQTLKYLAAYKAGNFERCEKMLKKDYALISTMTMTDQKLNILLYYAVIKAKLGDAQMANKLIKEIDKVKIADSPIAFDIIAHYKGIFSIANDVKAKLKDKNTDWSTYDPFKL